MTPDENALLLAAQQAAEDGIVVFGRSFGMVEHAVSKRRYVVETVDFGPAMGRLNLWSPIPHAAAQLKAFADAERMARSGIVPGTLGLEQALQEFRRFNGQAN